MGILAIYKGLLYLADCKKLYDTNIFQIWLCFIIIWLTNELNLKFSLYKWVFCNNLHFTNRSIIFAVATDQRKRPGRLLQKKK